MAKKGGSLLSAIFFFILLVVVVGFLGKNILAKVAVEKGVNVATGLEASVNSFNLGLLSTKVGMKDFKIYNPKGFADKVMFHSPEIYVDYVLSEMLKGKVHLTEARIDIDELMVIRNADGVLNIDALKPKEQAKKEEKPEQKKAGKAPEIQIDVLKLRVNKVVFKEYRKSGEPLVQEFIVGLDEEMHDVKSAQELIGVIMMKSLMKTPLANVANMANFVEGNVKDITNKALGTVTDTIKLGDKIKLPFGNK